LAWIWDGAQKAGLSLDTSRGSRLFELAPEPRSPLSPFDDESKGVVERARAAVINSLWRRTDRTGPAKFRGVSPSARRRWRLDPAELPEKKAYRPKPLRRFRKELKALPEIPPPPQAGTYRMVRVAPGESLAKIAQRELGAGQRWREIFEMNRDSLDDPDHIYIGMPLRVPSDRPRGTPPPE